MALDYHRLMGMEPINVQANWSERDTIIYALGVGADELTFLYEQGLQALPTMAGVLAYPGFIWKDPKYGLDWQRILHVEQALEFHGPIPVCGTISGATKIDAIVDKGADKGAIIYSSRDIFNESGEHFATARAAVMARGDGGFGEGDEPRQAPEAPPARAPDHIIRSPVSTNQALVYRLSGDLNPLHADPEVARSAGFTTPILHGMCTYGVAGRALLKSLCDNDPARLKSVSCRFSAPVYPGETIITEIWDAGNGTASFRASVAERNLMVLTHGSASFDHERI